MRCVAMAAAALLLRLPGALPFAIVRGGSRGFRSRAPLLHAGAAPTAEVSAEQLEEIYAGIAAQRPAQDAAYEAYVAGLDEEYKASLVSRAKDLGLEVDFATGHISYAKDFVAPSPSFDLVYTRHGKTTGNTEPRVYQGYVDEPKNALNAIGLGQAEEAADKLEALGLRPDLVVLSPLARAADTGRAYVRRVPGLEAATEEWEVAAEQRFGAWDNARVMDLPAQSICHLFYLDANACVKSDKPYIAPDGTEIEGECFVEAVLRAKELLDALEARVAALERPEDAGRPLVLVYGHSMAGAALSILTGNGKVVEGAGHLGFDGPYIMPNATPVFLVKG